MEPRIGVLMWAKEQALQPMKLLMQAKSAQLFEKSWPPKSLVGTSFDNRSDVHRGLSWPVATTVPIIFSTEWFLFLFVRLLQVEVRVCMKQITIKHCVLLFRVSPFRVPLDTPAKWSQSNGPNSLPPVKSGHCGLGRGRICLGGPLFVTRFDFINATIH